MREGETGVPTDEELALGIQQGHMQALAALVERHHHALIGFLYRMTGGNRALAEDLAQETFLRVLRAIGQYQHPRPFKPWLYAIAANMARDGFKSAKQRYAAALLEDDERGPAADERPEEVLIDLDEEQQVARALRRLPDHQRAVVILRYYQELSLAEIAEALNIPVGTVKSRLSIGLERLRTLLVE
ncbi:MAG: RNA polymerase sigma factor [Chloroflexi bacterium]|nr:RNA polymerase sigma factor [Chloroflexota bacterium]